MKIFSIIKIKWFYSYCQAPLSPFIHTLLSLKKKDSVGVKIY